MISIFSHPLWPFGAFGAGIAGFQQMLRDLAASGINITTFTWEPDGVWSTPKARTRGDVETRAADAGVGKATFVGRVATLIFGLESAVATVGAEDNH